MAEVPDLGDLDSKERFELLGSVAVDGIRELMAENGFERLRMVLMIEAPSDEPGMSHAGTITAGQFAGGQAQAFEMVLEHAGAMAQSVGYVFMVTPSSSPKNPVKGQG